ncbi:MAG: hypothetical protein ACSLFJ_15595 [Immundisolibacter sp.]|uniref:hypothetical protein n=1 Tax=Immundisolibacter sp. TaxID=1934948 RepID=UPI003EDF256A
MKDNKLFNRGLYGLSVALLVLSSQAFAVGAPPKDICTVSSIQLVGAAPGTVDANGTVTAGTGVTVTGQVTQAYPATSPSCDAGIAGTSVDEGTLTIGGQTDDGTPVACNVSGVGSFHPALKVQGLPATPAGTVTYDLNTTSLGGVTRGYRTAYAKLTPNGSFTSSTSPCVNLTVNNTDPSAFKCDGYAGIVRLLIVGAAGKGIVAPGEAGPWDYTFEVLNCTGTAPLTVKVQGGTSGWTTFQSAVTNPTPDGTLTSVAKSNGKKGTTSTVTWITSLDDATTDDSKGKTIKVTVNGTVPSGSPDGWQHLSGPWSAAYNLGGVAMKSDYTDRVYLEVVNVNP